MSENLDDNLDDDLIEGGVNPDNATIRKLRATIDREKKARLEAEARVQEAEADRARLAEIEAATRLAAIESGLRALGLGVSAKIVPADVKPDGLKEWAVSVGLLTLPPEATQAEPAFVPFSTQESVPAETLMDYQKWLELFNNQATHEKAMQLMAEGKVKET